MTKRPSTLAIASLAAATGAEGSVTGVSLAVPHVRALEHIQRMRGGCQSHLLRCSDGEYYVVKFKDNPQGTRILANELLSGLLARLLGLPMPEVAIVDVTAELIRSVPELAFELVRSRRPCLSGWSFGSRYMPYQSRSKSDPLTGRWPYPSAESLRQTCNRQDFAGALVFDKWTSNIDGRQFILVRQHNGASLRALMIDQGLCFGGEEWKFCDKPRNGLYWPFSAVAYESICGIEHFEPWLQTLENSIDATALERVAREIPAEWYEADADALAALITQLDNRRRIVRDLLWSSRHAFPSFFPNWLIPPECASGLYCASTFTNSSTASAACSG